MEIRHQRVSPITASLLPPLLRWRFFYMILRKEGSGNSDICDPKGFNRISLQSCILPLKTTEYHKNFLGI